MKIGTYQLDVNMFGMSEKHYPDAPHIEITVGYDNTWIAELVKKALLEEVQCAIDESRYDEVVDVMKIIKDLDESIKTLESFAEKKEREEKLDNLSIELD